jgi:hypothetical protein
MRYSSLIFAVLFTCLNATPAWSADNQLVHVVRFNDYSGGSIEDWLKGKGFKLERDAARQDRIDLGVGENGLDLDIKRRALGLMHNESVNVPDFTHVEIDWGVSRFPAGASYEQGVRNEALMVIFFLGDERHASGSMFIPDSPYFVGLFLCDGTDRLNYPYVGAYFKKGGRYVCTGRPAPGKLVTSRFNLLAAYRSFFDKEADDDPAISGIALTVDTQKAKRGGKALPLFAKSGFTAESICQAISQPLSRVLLGN